MLEKKNRGKFCYKNYSSRLSVNMEIFAKSDGMKNCWSLNDKEIIETCFTKVLVRYQLIFKNLPKIWNETDLFTAVILPQLNETKTEGILNKEQDSS